MPGAVFHCQSSEAVELVVGQCWKMGVMVAVSQTGIT
jgi:hypothetical protein